MFLLRYGSDLFVDRDSFDGAALFAVTAESLLGRELYEAELESLAVKIFPLPPPSFAGTTRIGTERIILPKVPITYDVYIFFGPPPTCSLFQHNFFLSFLSNKSLKGPTNFEQLD